jgi:hypothetical protein
MKMRNIAAAALAVGGALGFGTAANADRYYYYESITVGPPVARVEVVPAPRAGYIYEQGHYVWDGSRYVWSDGRYIAERPGHTWTAYVLEQRGPTWYYSGGHWDDDEKGQ